MEVEQRKEKQNEGFKKISSFSPYGYDRFCIGSLWQFWSKSIQSGCSISSEFLCFSVNGDSVIK